MNRAWGERAFSKGTPYFVIYYVEEGANAEKTAGKIVIMINCVLIFLHILWK